MVRGGYRLNDIALKWSEQCYEPLSTRHEATLLSLRNARATPVALLLAPAPKRVFPVVQH